MHTKTESGLPVADAAYLAGFTDGEGCIGIYVSGPSHQRQRATLRIQIKQNDVGTAKETMDFLTALFGGRRGQVITYTGKQHLSWTASGDACARFLNAVRPYLRLKREQADVAVAWHAGREPLRRDERGRAMLKSDTEIARDRMYADTVRLLKTLPARALIEKHPELRPCIEDALPDVLAAQGPTIEVLHTLTPRVVVMAGAGAPADD